jgi:hypothetical protein
MFVEPLGTDLPSSAKMRLIISVLASSRKLTVATTRLMRTMFAVRTSATLEDVSLRSNWLISMRKPPISMYCPDMVDTEGMTEPRREVGVLWQAQVKRSCCVVHTESARRRFNAGTLHMQVGSGSGHER